MLMEYFAGDIILFIVWVTFFLLRKDLRREMVVMSLLAIPISLFELLYVPSYWIPVTWFNLPIGIEGIIFSFGFGGVAAVSYAEVGHKKLIKIGKYHRPITFLALAVVIPALLLFKYFYSTNIAIAVYFGLLAGIFTLIFIRKDLLKSALAGAIIFGTIYASALILWAQIFPHTREWFTLEGVPKIFILNASFYEMILGILFGAYWGNLYELLFGYRFK